MQPNLINYEKNNSHSNRIKLPKNITLWMYLELKNNLSNEIRYLREEIAKKDEIISKLSSPVQEVREIVQAKEYKPVGNKRNSARVLAQMESIEMRKYWEDEIKRRENLVTEEGNLHEESKSERNSISS